ncbi:MAG: serine/threonine-protein kinase [Sandaracinaceae bacterium]
MGEDDTEQAPQVGTVLEGRYRLLETLGSGGVGWVYRAKHLRLAQDVAIKMLKEQYAQHELLRPRFDREAQALAALRHPNIVSLTDYSIGESGHPYLVMEMLEGKTLADAIEAGPIEESRARRILGQILDALTYAHSRGFAHRDIKPSNVFLVSLPTDPDHVKILDFGFVKLMSVEAPPTESQALTRSGIAFGTPSYMCPEQATGGDTDPRSDLYSTTVVFFEMLAGRRPYIGEIPDVIRAHLTEPVPPLSVGGANLRAKPELRAFLERGMAKEPVDRFDSAEDMKSALVALPTPMLGPADAAGDPTARHPAETPTAAPPARERPPGERPPHERPPGRAPRHAAGYVALAALGLGGLIAIPLALFALSGAAGSSDAVASDALASDAVSAEGITLPAMEAR